jgi:hypothetical protein
MVAGSVLCAWAKREEGSIGVEKGSAASKPRS